MRYKPYSILVLISLILCVACSKHRESKIETITIEAPLYQLNKTQASTLIDLPLGCVETEYPNKLNQTLLNDSHLGSPKELHPAFYGCFDWHSSVHGHWSIVKLLKEYPQIAQEQEAKNKLQINITEKKIAKEIEYFKRSTENSYERTYGWGLATKTTTRIKQLGYRTRSITF